MLHYCELECLKFIATFLNNIMVISSTYNHNSVFVMITKLFFKYNNYCQNLTNYLTEVKS